jgi:hypothetical protein
VQSGLYGGDHLEAAMQRVSRVMVTRLADRVRAESARGGEFASLTMIFEH